MSLVQELRKRYGSGKGWNIFFDNLTTYTQRRRTLNADVAENATGLSKRTILDQLRELGELRVGEFKLGRRQAKTRIEWHYTPQSIGMVARGEVEALEKFDDDGGEAEASEPLPALSIGDLLRAAKEELAAKLGVSPEQIEITIKH